MRAKPASLLAAVGVGAALLASAGAAAPPMARGTGDLGIIVERASGRVLIVETTTRTRIGAVEGLGDLSHASAVFSRDMRHAFVFGRDGGLSKIDLIEGRLVKRVVQAGNSIGGAISQDGGLVAVANYEPGGVKIFDTRTLEPVAEIPAETGDLPGRSKVVGLVDVPGARFVFSLYEAGEIWAADLSDPARPKIIKWHGAGRQPYDGAVTGKGRYYIAGLFGEDRLALLDLWQEKPAPRFILEGYRHGAEPLPVYKMPHLEGWAEAGELLFLPAVGAHEIIAVERGSWREAARIPVLGQPVFAVARPDGRQVWVNFALPDNDAIQVIDVATLAVVEELRPGRGVLHMEFTPRGDQVWVSLRDDNRVDVFDPATFAKIASLEAESPSGIFFTARANRIGQ